VVALKLLPSCEQAVLLRDTLQTANVAANAIRITAWQARTFAQFKLHKLVYAETRATSGLSAQVVVRLIAKVADAYKVGCDRKRRFRPLGAIAYDDHILRYGSEYVSIWTTGGRQSIPFTCGPRQRTLLASRQGESDLVCRSGEWYLLAMCTAAEPPTAEVDDYLGIDLGIKNIAATSDGELFAGSHVNGLRRRHARLRARLQRKRTRSAKRLLRRRRLKEQRFSTLVNHTISKRLVRTAQCTKRGLALENLEGIRSRIKARRSQRRILHSWSFNQLRKFIAYKATLAGVLVVYVDPRNTSRTCPAPNCGWVDPRNRPTQALFKCVRCGLAGPADAIAAENIRVRGRAVCKPAVRAESGVMDRVMGHRVETPSCKSRPHWLAVGLRNRLVNGHQLGSVGKRRFDLHVRDHLGDAIHHVGAGEDGFAETHQVCHRAAITRAFHQLAGDERDRLRVVELHAALAAPARQVGRDSDQQLLLLTGCQVHRGCGLPSEGEASLRA
jgi:putative transposase